MHTIRDRERQASEEQRAAEGKPRSASPLLLQHERVTRQMKRAAR